MNLVKLELELEINYEAVFVIVEIIQEVFGFLVAEVLDVIVGHIVDWLVGG